MEIEQRSLSADAAIQERSAWMLSAGKLERAAEPRIWI
jgi:hypothetical protein